MEGQSPPGTAPSLRVLLVEDSALLAERIGEFIKRLRRVQVIGVVDTEAEAVWHIRESSPDVVILDIHLREGSGFGVLRALHGTTRPKIIVLTNYGSSEYRGAAQAFGAYAFLDKSREFGRLDPLLFSLTQAHTRPQGAPV